MKKYSFMFNFKLFMYCRISQRWLFSSGYSHTKWEFFNGYDSKSRNIIQSCGRISIGIEKNRIRFYLNDDIFSQFLFVYFTLDCHYFVKKY